MIERDFLGHIRDKNASTSLRKCFCFPTREFSVYFGDEVTEGRDSRFLDRKWEANVFSLLEHSLSLEY